jgi:hypothetical protein
MIRSSKFGSLNHGLITDLNMACMPLDASPASKVRLRGEADVGQVEKPADSVENDP